MEPSFDLEFVLDMLIDWKKLTTARGVSDASQVPFSIELLFSETSNKRDTGYWGIDNHVVVQSDLQDSAPYATQLIVERFLAEKQVTQQLVDILFELANGANSEVLTVGPLSGETVESICRSKVLETKRLLEDLISELPPSLQTSVGELLGSLS